MGATLKIDQETIHWAAQECEWQQSGALSVTWMLDGWLYAKRRQRREIRPHDIIELGRTVEPRHNKRGYRKVGVRVGWDVKLDWPLVPDAMAQLLGQQGMDPVEWFRQYEEIHPFRDGNGRTGNILYNWLNGSLDRPVFPPNLWHDPRRDL